ncbi:hypothetical protein [Sinosporangium siamense]|uniref:Uncharacterized protein n=1 Tax=Sinosporangium siamense TaxID=1367973 RepID=A0A919RLG6_9ACTN|nr:hypothetical protein [Sinosporangium siamense]GII95015.1 hypothetical protein Ssi02_52460 [Sinosporangium siamense]
MSFLARRFNLAPEQTSPVSAATEGSETLVFASPSVERAFDFTVTAQLTYRPNGRSSRWSPDQEEINHVGDLARRMIRHLTAAHSIFTADTAEKAVNAQLSSRFPEAARVDMAVVSRWNVAVELELPEEVKAVVRTHLLNVYEIKARAEAAETRVAKLQESSAIWEKLLAETSDSAFARYAIRLTDDPNKAADVVEQMLDARRADAERLLTLMTDIVKAQQSAGVYDLVLASDSALRAAFQRLGIALPPPAPDSLFAPLSSPS